ncbi:chemotaxis protein CheB [Pedobacter hartonius]|nr:chemotaxis protein CheB [Pedobacter hartonius]
MKNSFYVVGIGLSAGGFQPLCEIFDGLPNKMNAAFIVAQHLSANFVSAGPELLARHTGLIVKPAVDGERIKVNTVYMLPEKAMVTVKDGKIIIRQRGSSELINKAIDILFESLSESFGTRVISIVLSGADGDGAKGSRQIFSNGGITFAQSPHSAAFPSMPETAIDMGTINFILSPFEIAKLLSEMIKGEVSQADIP